MKHHHHFQHISTDKEMHCELRDALKKSTTHQVSSPLDPRGSRVFTQSIGRDRERKPRWHLKEEMAPNNPGVTTPNDTEPHEEPLICIRLTRF
jgi:hypothetical protein